VSVVDVRRRLAGDLSHLDLDERAFCVAVEVFDEERRDSASSDAELRALETFLHAYLKAAGR
jgi:hypothetical protein